MATKLYFTCLHLVKIQIVLISYISIVSTLYANEWLDRRCNVYVNLTRFKQDQKLLFPKKKNEFLACQKNKFHSKNRERNLTKDEKRDCSYKCYQIHDRHATNDGYLNPKISEIIKEYYETYSNATSFYINGIINMFTGCAKQANGKIKLLQENRTIVGECEVNGFYDDCCMDYIDNQFNYLVEQNKTAIEFCGNKRGTQ